MKVHFSVDDTCDAFLWLSQYQKDMTSIFCQDAFCAAKWVYEKYGIPTSFYCMGVNKMKPLSEASLDKFVEEFAESSHFMNFGFHGIDYETNYNESDEAQVLADYDSVMNEVSRITGLTEFTDTIRLHYFSGNEAICKALHEKKGINTFLCADDERISYGLSEKNNKAVRKKGVFEDKKNQITYKRTDIRLENVEDVEACIKQIKKYDEVNIFTHEMYLERPAILGTLFKILDACTE